MIRVLRRNRFLKILPAVLFLWTAHCEAVGESLRRWGEENRRSVAPRLDEDQLKQWERDLSLSRAKALELREQLHALVEESALQGRLSREIARAYMNAGRYALAALHYQAAAGQQAATENERGVLTFEQAIPYFEDALRRHNVDPELLFEAGLCFANASHALGWEAQRWEAAVYLFQRLARVRPEDTRPLYQLALLYGKTTDSSRRNLPRAVDLLEQVIQVENKNVPARFALAHLAVEQGDLEKAGRQYENITVVLKDLERRGVVGNLKDNQSYANAQENLNSVRDCLNGSPDCAVRTGL